MSLRRDVIMITTRIIRLVRLGSSVFGGPSVDNAPLLQTPAILIRISFLTAHYTVYYGVPVVFFDPPQWPKRPYTEFLEDILYVQHRVGTLLTSPSPISCAKNLQCLLDQRSTVALLYPRVPDLVHCPTAFTVAAQNLSGSSQCA